MEGSGWPPGGRLLGVRLDLLGRQRLPAVIRPKSAAAPVVRAGFVEHLYRRKLGVHQWAGCVVAPRRW